MIVLMIIKIHDSSYSVSPNSSIRPKYVSIECAYNVVKDKGVCLQKASFTLTLPIS